MNKTPFKFLNYVLLALFPLFHSKHASAEKFDCRRIISLAPSITETIYQLGLADNIEGVTTYCKFPAEALKKAKIGGFLDPNYEIMLGLKPTIAVHLKEQNEIALKLKQLGISTLEIDHSNTTGIMQSILTVGAACNKDAEAVVLHEKLDSKLKALLSKALEKNKPRVLLAVGRSDVNSLQGIYAAGSDGFLSELLGLAGGININNGSTINFPAISSENILKANPEVIIEIIAVPEISTVKTLPDSAILKSWQPFEIVDAVKNKKVFLLSEDYMTIPGPRFTEALEAIINTLHNV